MKKAYVITILIIIALVSAIFNFVFLINKGIFNVEETLDYLVTPLNGVSFYVTLFVIIFAFFFNRKIKVLFGIVFLLLCAIDILIMVSLKSTNYLFLIPIIFNLYAGILTLTYDKE